MKLEDDEKEQLYASSFLIQAEQRDDHYGVTSPSSASWTLLSRDQQQQQKQQQKQLSSSLSAVDEAISPLLHVTPELLTTTTTTTTRNNSTTTTTTTTTNDNTTTSSSLSWPLRTLYALDGITLALPSTALMFIVNTRVQMPLNLLSTYGAIVFMPMSLKPIYGYLSNRISRNRRDRMLVVLLVCSGVMVSITAFIPQHKNGIILCFLIGFVRSISYAWPEFLLGLTLLDEARQLGQEQPFSSTSNRATLFQSQAATARNVGSFMAHIFVFLLLSLRQWWWGRTMELNDGVTTFLLFLTAGLNFIAATIAGFYQVGRTKGRGPVIESISADTNPSLLSSTGRSTTNPGTGVAEYISRSESSIHMERIRPQSWEQQVGNYSITTRVVVVFQLTLVWIALRQPMVDAISNISWTVITIVTLTVLVMLLWKAGRNNEVSNPTWKRWHIIGTFLVLCNAIPTIEYLMDSFMFAIFQKTAPSFLSLLSISEMFTTTIASWSYGLLFTRFQVQLVIVATTSLAACTCLFANSIIVATLAPDVNLTFSVVVTTILVKSALTFTGEWKFLPNVVLATIGAADLVDVTQSTDNTECDYDQVGIIYGTLVSCIDFGDQLGALLLAPLVAAIGTSRENDWAHLETLVVIESGAMMLSLTLVFLLY